MARRAALADRDRRPPVEGATRVGLLGCGVLEVHELAPPRADRAVRQGHLLAVAERVQLLHEDPQQRTQTAGVAASDDVQASSATTSTDRHFVALLVKDLVLGLSTSGAT